MAQVFDDADLWLSPPPPSHFLSVKSPPLTMNKAVGGGASAWRSAEMDAKFPYEFGFKSEVASPVIIQSVENDFFFELNRRLTLSDARHVAPIDLRQPFEVSKAVGGSPQSILGGIGSWSGQSSYQSPLQGPSPPATPYEAEYDTTRLINAAAGQVERLKMSYETSLKANVKAQNHIPVAQNHTAGFFAEQNKLDAARRAYNAALLYEHHLQILSKSARCSKPVTESSRMFVNQHQPRVCNKPSFQFAPLQKRESSGTGVFLPRRYDTSPVTPPRKRAVATNAFVPAKVVQVLNMSFDELNCQTQPHYSSYAASMSYKSYEALMARRKAFLAQQQLRASIADDLSRNSLDASLPQEWSY